MHSAFGSRNFLQNVLGTQFGSSLAPSSGPLSSLESQLSGGLLGLGASQGLIQHQMNQMQNLGLSGLLRMSEERTGVTETRIGTPVAVMTRRPLSESEPYPPTDWPDYP